MKVPGILLLLSQLIGSAATYTVQDLGLPDGFAQGRGTDLNNYGQVVGWVENTENVSQAFLWNKGSMHLLGQPGWAESVASSINNRGEISGAALLNGGRHAVVWLPDAVDFLGQIDSFPKLGMPGYFVPGTSISDNSRVVARLQTTGGKQRTALWSDGHAIFFGALDDGRICYGQAINHHDQIVGQVFDTNSHSRPFLWHQGNFVDLGTLGGTRASATQINDQGMITGWALPPDAKLRQAQAFVWTEANGMQSLGTLGGATSRAYDINNAGQIVGYSRRKDGSLCGFLWERGTMRDLNAAVTESGWRLTSATAINDRSQILATATPPGGGTSRAVLLNPHSVAPSELSPSPSINPVQTGSSPDVTFRLIALERAGDGSIRLEFTDRAWAEYAIEVSTDLRTWTRLGSAERSDSTFTFTDSSANRAKLCFYRAVRISQRPITAAK